jgi:hypothetical protein
VCVACMLGERGCVVGLLRFGEGGIDKRES